MFRFQWDSVIKLYGGTFLQLLSFIPYFRFKWDVSHLGPHFSISPTDGYISSGMEVMFDVVFHPQEISADIRNDVSRSVFHTLKHKISRKHEIILDSFEQKLLIIFH